MLKTSEIEQIKRVIEKGVDLELISFELDIPMEELMQIKLELDESKKKPHTSETKLQKIRERYKQLYYGTDKAEEKAIKLPEKEIEYINSVIAKIEDMTKDIENMSKQQAREVAFEILTETKKIKTYPLTFKQAERLYNIIKVKQLKGLKQNQVDKIDINIQKRKKELIRKLIEAVDFEQSQTDDLNELKALNRKISTELVKENPIFAHKVKSKITRKIDSIQSKIAVNRLKNDFSTKVESIIADIANGTLDVEMANDIINEEISNRKKNKPNNKFSLTDEQEKEQIMQKIRKQMSEKSEQYYIQDPEMAVMQLQGLYGGRIEQAIGVVVDNLINAKRFEEAKEICDKLWSREISAPIFILRKEIKNSEIGNMILKGINMNGIEEEEKAYFELIEKGIKKGNVKPDEVHLGKSQDGLKTITLEDIWTDKARKR